MEFIYKELCVYSYMFKLQSPSKYSPFDTIHLQRHFFPLLKTVFEFVDFDAFQCFCHFLFHLFHIGKTFPFEDFFHLGNPKKRSLRTRSGNREGGAWGHAMTWCGLVHSLITHHETSKCVKRIFKKHSLKLNTASHNNASWYTGMDGFLEHSPSRDKPVLQGPHLPEEKSDFGGSPLIKIVRVLFRKYEKKNLLI